MPKHRQNECERIGLTITTQLCMVHVIWLVNPLFYAMFKGLNPTKMTIELSKLNYSQNMATEARKCHFPVQVCEIRRKRLTKTLKSYSGDYKDSTHTKTNCPNLPKKETKVSIPFITPINSKESLSKNSVSNLTWKGGGGGGRGEGRFHNWNGAQQSSRALKDPFQL